MNEYEYENKTIVKFDDKLKQLVADLIQENPKYCITDLKDSNMELLEEAQHVIREYFKYNRDKLTLTETTSFHYPDYYALLMAVVADLSKCSTWDNVFDQVPKNHNNTLELYQELPEKDITYCACSHWCLDVNTALVMNPYTRMKLSLGSCCIEKTKILTKHEFRKMCLTNTIYYNKIQDRKEVLRRKKHKQCTDCLCWNIRKEKPDTKCDYCFAVSQIRTCKDCPAIIPNTSPSWIKYCKSCYFKLKGITRTCKDCPAIIPNTSPSWVKYCKSCYFTSQRR